MVTARAVDCTTLLLRGRHCHCGDIRVAWVTERGRAPRKRKEGENPMEAISLGKPKRQLEADV